MTVYEELYDDVKSRLSEKRFKHTEGVVKRAIEYAEVYGTNIEDTKIAALAHDIAKEISQEESLELLKKYNIKLDDIEKDNFNLVHSKLGAEIVKEKYSFNEDIINAIRFHTTGRENMSILEKIIFLADATEENRTYKELDMLVNMIKENIDEGMIYTFNWTFNDITNKRFLLHLDSVKAYNYLVKKA